jgi:uncharacterized protein (TIGR02145 family)
MDGDGIGSYVSYITDLEPNTTYYARAYATNSKGTAYGNAISFKTLQHGSVTDFDGNTYQTGIINGKEWMFQNLKVTHYRNGDLIQMITDNNTWIGLTSGAYCDYNNEANNANTYGHMYNWYSVDDSRGLCPSGWHIPSESEYASLISFLGGTNLAGGKMKEVGTTHWNSPNTGATDEVGFKALPAGYRSNNNGLFGNIGNAAYLWTSTPSSAGKSWGILLNNTDSNATPTSYYYRFGFSVRCMKD